MFPLIATAWMVFWLIALVMNCSSERGVAIFIAWALIGIFPPVFYKLMAM